MTVGPVRVVKPARLPDDWPAYCPICKAGGTAVAKRVAEEAVASTLGILEMFVCREGRGWHTAVSSGRDR